MLCAKLHILYILGFIGGKYMKMELKRRALVVTLSLMLIVGMGSSIAVTQVSAATITDPLDFTLELSNPDYPGTSGDGWTWNVSSQILELNGLNINCSIGDAAIKLPDGSEIILAAGSTNQITNTASGGNGITCEGDLEINGAGNLEIDAVDVGVRAVGNLSVDGLVEFLVYTDVYSALRAGPGRTSDNGSYGGVAITNCGTVYLEAYTSAIRAIGNVTIDGVNELYMESLDYSALRTGPDNDADYYTGEPGDVSITNCASVDIKAALTGIRAWGDITFDNVTDTKICGYDANGIRVGTDTNMALGDISDGSVFIKNCHSFEIEARYNGIRAIGDVNIEEVDALTIVSEEYNGIRCGQDDDGDIYSSANGDLTILNCGVISITNTDAYNGVAVYGDLTATNVTSLLMTAPDKGLKTWGSASFINCLDVQAIGSETNPSSDYEGFGMMIGEELLIENSNVLAAGGKYGIVTGFSCEYQVEPSLGGDIILTKSNVVASCSTDENGIAAIYAGDNGTFQAKIILNDSVILTPEVGYVVDVNLPESNSQTITTIEGLTEVTSIDQIAKGVTIGAEYTVTYNANGGEGSVVDSANPYLIGSTVTVLEGDFSKDGAKFAGLNTMADGSGTMYDVGDTFEIMSDVTLYATYEVLESPLTGDGTTG